MKIISIMTIVYLIYTILFGKGTQFNIFVLYAFYMCGPYVCFWQELRMRKQKPLVFTKRATRLYITNLILNIILLLIIHTICVKSINDAMLYSPVVLFIGTLLYYFQPETMYISNILIKPVEDSINRWYFRQAQER